MNVELRHLRYFVAVAELLSFTAAAQRLHIAQPALSRAIRDLEKALGVELFRRTTRLVELTAVGAVFLPDARAVLESFDAALARAQEASQGDRRVLRVGFRPAASLPLLEPIVREFRRRYPHVTIEPLRVEWSDHIQCIMDRRADVTFTMGPIDHPQIEVTPLMVVPRAVATPLDHPLAHRREVRIADLAPYRMAVPANATPGWAEFWTGMPRPIDPGIEPGPAVANADESVAVLLSGAALVITVSTVRTYNQDIRVIPIVDIDPATIVLATAKTNRSHLVRAFQRTSVQVSESLGIEFLHT